MFHPFLRNVLMKQTGTDSVLMSHRLRERRFREQALATVGTIVRVDTETSALRDGGHLIFEYPVVRFRTQKGQTIEFRSPHGFTPCRSYVGESVPVLYNLAEPTDARVQVRSVR
jgi:hypothetical protein